MDIDTDMELVQFPRIKNFTPPETICTFPADSLVSLELIKLAGPYKSWTSLDAKRLLLIVLVCDNMNSAFLRAQQLLCHYLIHLHLSRRQILKREINRSKLIENEISIGLKKLAFQKERIVEAKRKNLGKPCMKAKQFKNDENTMKRELHSKYYSKVHIVLRKFNQKLVQIESKLQGNLVPKLLTGSIIKKNTAMQTHSAKAGSINTQTRKIADTKHALQFISKYIEDQHDYLSSVAQRIIIKWKNQVYPQESVKKISDPRQSIRNTSNETTSSEIPSIGNRSICNTLEKATPSTVENILDVGQLPLFCTEQDQLSNSTVNQESSFTALSFRSASQIQNSHLDESFASNGSIFRNLDTYSTLIPCATKVVCLEKQPMELQDIICDL